MMADFCAHLKAKRQQQMTQVRKRYICVCHPAQDLLQNEELSCAAEYRVCSSLRELLRPLEANPTA